MLFRYQVLCLVRSPLPMAGQQEGFRAGDGGGDEALSDPVAAFLEQLCLSEGLWDDSSPTRDAPMLWVVTVPLTWGLTA